MVFVAGGGDLTRAGQGVCIAQLDLRSAAGILAPDLDGFLNSGCIPLGSS